MQCDKWNNLENIKMQVYSVPRGYTKATQVCDFVDQHVRFCWGVYTVIIETCLLQAILRDINHITLR